LPYDDRHGAKPETPIVGPTIGARLSGQMIVEIAFIKWLLSDRRHHRAPPSAMPAK
jgi:hypothetical protein